MPISSQSNGSQKKLRCSRCGTEFLREDTNTVPFCSRRCQQLDLRNWLNEEYGLPYEGGDEQPYIHDEEENE